MNDVVYAGFAQLSYLNWHKLNSNYKNSKLKAIFADKSVIFNQIKTLDYNEMQTDGKDYYEKLENKKKIYKSADSRLFYLYSEHRDAPNANPKYPEFGEWQFLEGYNHKKIYNKMEFFEELSYKDSIYQPEKLKIKEIDLKDSGFQASVFKKDNDIIIAYRGTEEVDDWLRANIPSGADFVTDQLSCAIYVYENVMKSYKKPEMRLHITGHSLGGSLAQYIAGYSMGKHLTRCWNSLGLGDKNIVPTNKKNKIHTDKFKENYKYCINNKNIKNFSFSNDFVGSLFEKLGITIIVDRLHQEKVRNLKNIHSISNFLPFFDGNGNINIDRHLSHNFLMNSFKFVLQTEKSLVPKIEKGKKGVKLEKIYDYAISKDNKKNLLWHCIESSFKREDTNWYTASVPEVGIFNNIAIIAGVPGGDPYPLIINSNKKTASILKTSNGNFVISKNV